MNKYLICLVSLGLVSNLASAQTKLLMPDSTNNVVVEFDPFDGSLVNPNLFAITPSTTPVHAMQVGNEIWISEQIGDKLSRWSFTGTSLGAVSGALDNVRGMALVNGTVYACNAGTANGAPGNALRMFDTAGNSLGFFATASSSPFGILEQNGTLLVSSSAANDDVHRYGLAGGSLGTFHNSTSLNFGEQMDYATNGEILVAGFSTNNIVRLDPVTGALVSSFTASGARGLHQLGNGNIMWTSGAGAFVFNTSTGGTTQVYTGGGRYLDLVTVPEPCTMIALAAAGSLLLRRRRREG